MAAFIVPDDDSGRIITFDVIENELHESIAEITEHPVEKGVNISDHIRPLPDRFSMTAYTSNTPVFRNPFTQRGETRSIKLEVPTWTPPIEATPGSLFRSTLCAIDGLLFGGPPEAVATVLAFSEEFNAINETYAVLLEFLDNGTPLQIITPIRVYEDMAFERVAAPRTSGDAGVSFGLDVKKIRIVESGLVAAPPVPADNVPGGVPLENKGGQGAKPPGAGEDPSKRGSIVYEKAKAMGLI